MGRFLIEVSHEATLGECGRATELLLKSGSHFVSEADFGCPDGVHKGWIVVDVDTKEEALAIVPPVYRSRATIVQLTKFSIEDIGTLLELHNLVKAA